VKKTLYTLDIGDYAPEIKAITFPLQQAWADKIGATFVPITQRKFEGWPVVYEKLQIRDIAAERDDDWSIFLDADAMIHPDLFDLTERLPMDTVFHYGSDQRGIRFAADDYFRRDGRFIGSCNWFTIGSRWCRDLWRPLDDLTLEQAVTRIFPTVAERNGDGTPGSVVEASHLIDDYTLSRNIARFGLKFQNATDLFTAIGSKPGYAWHVYNKANTDKINGWTVDQELPDGRKVQVKQPGMKDVLVKWNLRPAGG